MFLGSEYAKKDPLRAFDWRYRRAQEIMASPGRSTSRKRDDAATSTLARVLKRLAVNDSPRTIRNIYTRNPDVYTAYQIYTHNGTAETTPEDSYVQAEMGYILEARLLAGQSDEEIGKLLGMLPEAVHAYEQLFFNCRDRLKSQDYITGQLIQRCWQRERRSLPMATLVKLFAYHSGPLVLDVVLHGFDTSDRPRDRDEIGSYMHRQLQRAIDRRAMIESADLDVNRFNALQLVESSARLQDLTKAKDSDPSSKMELGKNVAQFFQQINWQVVGDQKEGAGALGRYNESAVEPSAIDAFQLAEGKVPATVHELANKAITPEGLVDVDRPQDQ